MVDHVDATARVRLAAVAAALEGSADDVTTSVEDAIRDAIPEFAADSTLSDLREASIRANVLAMLQLVRVGIDSADVKAPDAALAYAQRLAEYLVPPALIVRCYRVGQSRFLRHCLEELSRQELADGDGDPQVDHVTSIVLIDHISDFIDRVLDQVLAAYADGREPGVSTTPDVTVGSVAEPDLDAEVAEIAEVDDLDAVSRSAPPRAR